MYKVQFLNVHLFEQSELRDGRICLSVPFPIQDYPPTLWCKCNNNISGFLELDSIRGGTRLNLAALSLIDIPIIDRSCTLLVRICEQIFDVKKIKFQIK